MGTYFIQQFMISVDMALWQLYKHIECEYIMGAPTRTNSQCILLRMCVRVFMRAHVYVCVRACARMCGHL